MQQQAAQDLASAAREPCTPRCRDAAPPACPYHDDPWAVPCPVWGRDALKPPAGCPGAPSELSPARSEPLGGASQPKGVPRRAQTPPGRGPRRGRARPGRQVLLFGRRRDRAGGSARPPMLGGGTGPPPGPGPPPGVRPLPLSAGLGSCCPLPPGGTALLNAFGLQGRGRAVGIYPKSVLGSPQKCVCVSPQSLSGPQGSWPCRAGRGQWQQRALHRVGTECGGGQEQPPGIRALISAPAGGRSPPLGETSGDSRLSHVLFTCTHRNLPSAQPPALMLWRQHRLCLVPEGSPAEIGAAALRSLGRVRPWPLGFREVGSRVMGQDCG